MEVLKAQRKVLRKGFSEVYHKFIKCCESGSLEEAERCYHQLNSKQDRLNKNQEEIYRVVSTTSTEEEENQLTKDIETHEEYIEKMTEATFRLQRLKKTDEGKQEEEEDDENDDDDDDKEDVKTNKNSFVKLPKLSLIQYDLSYHTWLPFWAQYKGIYFNDSLGVGEKFQYLLMCLKDDSKARNMMSSYPQEPKHLEQAIEALKNRYGREDLLIEIYTRELVNIILSRENFSLSVLFDKISTQLRALESLGTTTDKCALILYPLVESCLPTEFIRLWERRNTNTKNSQLSLVNYNQLDELMKFIEEEVRNEERVDLATRSPYNNKVSTAAALASTSNTFIRRCIFCTKNHNSHECLKQIDFRERENIIFKEKVCYKCLKKNHRASECKAFVKCLFCYKDHYVIMCKNLKKSDDKKPEEEEKDGKKQEALVSACLNVRVEKTTYLKTLLVQVLNGENSEVVRVLVDDGAHRNYITTSVVNKLRWKPVSHETVAHGLFGGKREPIKRYACYNLKLKGMATNSDIQDIFALEQQVICDQILGPSMMRDSKLFSELREKGITLTDVGDTDQPIDLLLGAEALGQLLTGNMHILKNGISAIETKLGWSVVGCSSKRAKVMVSQCLNAVSLPNMWELENIGISEPIMPKTGAEAVECFQNTIKRNDSGRFMVELPWIVEKPNIGENLEIAKRRLYKITDKLKAENLFETYNRVFQDWEEGNIIEEVKEIAEDEDKSIRHYLPHRHVLKKRSESSLKVRPVFDASAKTSGLALNQCLHKGPNLLQEIPVLLLKFRLYEFGVTADIKQAFLQLLVDPKDRDVLRFLWWKDNKEIIVYRHCRLVFGLICSPFLLNATLARLIDIEIEKYPNKKEVLTKLRNSFYVDDTVSSHSNPMEVETFMLEATETMKKGKFELCKWTSNAPGFENKDSISSVLGLKWHLINDNVFCVGFVEKAVSLTKRSLLSQMNAIYDPIGMLCPTLLIPKLLLQEAWALKVGWDEELPEALKLRYENWAAEINEIEEIQMPRKICHGDLDRGENSIHVFADACQKSYGCCIFLRHEEKGKISVRLIAAKAKIAPIQKHTIPRLELLAACIAVRLYNNLKVALPEGIKTTFWTDSMTVLWWVSRALPWATFVGNRVKEIRGGSDPTKWRHVPGIYNPADVASRGCKISDLKKLNWWNGPQWLGEGEEKWPNQELECTQEALAEVRVLTCIPNENDKFCITLGKFFSNYTKIIRLCAWLLRFKNKNKGSLTVDEITNAEERLIKLIQAESDITLKEIQTCKDEKGLVRVRSRVSSFEEQGTLLLILPSNNNLVSLLIYDTHKSMGHAGAEITLSKLREKFWIIRGRKTVKSVIGKCIYCKKFRGKPYDTDATVLPDTRTDVNAVAFQTTGIDLFGPFFLRDGSKVWGILFTCAVFRCVRLDIVRTMSTECFVRAFRRFLAKHNNVKTVITDNGTNFKGLANQLSEIDWSVVDKFVADRKLKMIQNPPAAPWWGGFFERLVGVVKDILKKQLGKASLEYDELLTLFYECEAIVNSRPLTYVSEDPRDFKPITPNHFLQESPGEPLADLDIVDEKSLIKRVQFVNEIRKSIRNRFAKEYLSLLVQRKRNSTKPIKVGQIVLVEGDNKKRIQWPLGKVIEIFPGKDNVVRVVKVTTQTGNFIRPVQRLYPLEGCERGSEVDGDNGDEGENRPDESDGGERVSSPELANDENKGELLLKESSTVTKCGRQVKAPNKLDL